MGGSMRLDSSGVLVVPPFECCWLAGRLSGGTGLCCFEARGETDVTVILKATPGAKRLQPLERTSMGPQSAQPVHALGIGPGPAAAAAQQQHAPLPRSTVEANYTVILGSHRNSCLKIEKNGSTVSRVQGVGGSRVNPKEFIQLWIDYRPGLITCGTGEPGPDTAAHQWVDQEAIPEITYVGLSCWDRHISYRNIKVLPSLNLPLLPGLGQQGLPGSLSPEAAAPETGPPPLFKQCMLVLSNNLGHPLVSAAAVAEAAELLLPATRPLFKASLDHLARNFSTFTASLPVPQPMDHSAQAPPALLSPCQSLLSPLSHEQRSLLEPGAKPPLAPGSGVKSLSEPGGRRIQLRGGGSMHVQGGAHPPLSNQEESSPSQLGVTSQLGNDGLMELEGGAKVGLSDWEQLPAAVVCELLQQNSITVREKEIFDAVVCWAMALNQHHGEMPENSFSSPPHLIAVPSESLGSVRPDAGSMELPACSMELPMGSMELLALTTTNATGPPPRSSSSMESFESSMKPSKSSMQLLVQTMFMPADGAGPAVLCGAGSAGDEEGSSSSNSVSGLAALVGARLEVEVLQVLSLIRYPLMAQQELEMVMQSALVRSSPALEALVHEARDAHLVQIESGITPRLGAGLFGKEHQGMLQRGSLDLKLGGYSQYQRRELPERHECGFVCDGDQNGVLRFIGTMYGAQEWMNPVLSHMVEVRASSPAGRHTDSKALPGDKFLRTNFAGPRFVNGQPDTWWLVDLCEHTLILTYYTIRHDGSSDYVRSWSLQGSQDLQSWVELQRHSNDPTVKRPGQYASWPVLGPAAQTPYRAFRVVLTGPTTSPLNPWNFPLAHLELYGYLHRPGSTLCNSERQSSAHRGAATPYPTL